MQGIYKRKTTAFKKELRKLASDFRLNHKPEVQEAISTCQNYEDGRRKIMTAYEKAYLK